MKNIRRTKIVGTIGPASESEEMLTKLVNAGLDIARINFSHGGYEENEEKINAIKNVRKNLKKPIGLMLDTKGPEIRTGVLEVVDQKVLIEEGQEFTFVHDDVPGNNTRTSIGYKDLYKDVIPGAKILVDDGAIAFKVKEIRDKDIICEALNTGRLGSRKTVNVPGLKLNLPALSQKDIEDITKGIEAGFDFIAASFVRRASDVQEIRELLKANGGENIQIISKIESQEGIDNFDEILEASDGIMVARGDMGVEIPMEKVPVVQKDFIKKCNAAGKPVITATQMLESMITNPRPTRAEVSDVANAVYDRTSCIMLSGECAMGKYPVECVDTMVKISGTIEKSIKYWERFSIKESRRKKTDDMEENIAYTTCAMAEHIEADAIATYTHTGNSVKKLAGIGSQCHVIAVTDCEKTYNQLSIAWNVMPVLIEGEESPEATLEKGIETLKEKGILKSGDVLVLSGGAQTFVNEKREKKVIGGITRV